jgi:hypothetical protein
MEERPASRDRIGPAKSLSREIVAITQFHGW